MIKNVSAKTFKPAVLGAVLMICISCAGLLYPRIRFGFFPAGDTPPETPEARFAAGADYPQEFVLHFSQYGNSFKKSAITTIFVRRPYSKLRMKEVSYEWSGGRGILMRNKEFKLGPDSYYEKDGWYWNGGLGRPLFSQNFERIFKNKEPGDEFNLDLKLTYSFDGEPDRTQILSYTIITMEGEYAVPTLMGR